MEPESTRGARERSLPRASIRLGCLVIVVILSALMLAACGGVLILLYQEGVFDEAPPLPSWARPADSEQLSNNGQVPCVQTDDWGPYSRYLVFGTDQDFEAVVAGLESEFRQHGWAVSTSPIAEGIVATSPKEDLRIWYQSRPWLHHNLEAERYEDDYRVLVFVVVTDCLGA